MILSFFFSWFTYISIIVGCPSIIRADRGTENCTVAFVQPALRHTHQDHFAGEKSFQYGRSSSNQVPLMLSNDLVKHYCKYVL